MWDLSTGTGALKVTPAHDPNDFEIGTRHELPSVKVIADDGTMTEAAGRFAGQDRFECRKAVVEALKAEGLLEKVEPIATAWVTATAARPWSSPTSHASGSSRPNRWPKRPSKRSKRAKRASSPKRGPKPTTSGCTTSATGASPDRSGGGTRFQLETTCQGCQRLIVAWKIPMSARIADPTIWCAKTGRARHLVLLCAMALLHHGLAGPDQLLKTYYPTSVLVTGSTSSSSGSPA